MDVSIRVANETDLDLIIDLNRSEYRDGHSDWKIFGVLANYEIAMWWGDKSLLQWHYSILKQTGGGILLLFVDDVLVGELDYCISSDQFSGKQISRAHIIWLLVDSKWRGMGFAKRLINTLKGKLEFDIWVEAEDERSIGLYESLGEKITTIVNYNSTNYIKKFLENEDVNIETITSSEHNYQQIANEFNDGKLRILIGRYYAPHFDILQLTKPDPHGIILGGMRRPDIISYHKKHFRILALVTQYPRVYMRGEINRSSLKYILNDIFDRIALKNYESIELQFYNGDIDTSILMELGFVSISDDDILYKIS